MKFDPSVSDSSSDADTAVAGSSDADGGDVLRLEMVDLEGMDSKGLFDLLFEINAARCTLDGYMTEVLNRYGDLLGEGEVRALCLQFGMGRYLANRQARTAGALRELHAELDQVTGERAKTALDGMCDRMFRDDSKNVSNRTHQQRAADALAALITQTLRTHPSKAPHPNQPTPHVFPSFIRYG
ncbi:hypothetical protein [Candidatus Poriferisocius sp.]|uniref:hypothetical protein n=1 Tax=Candidatus Poriferisocius sp. TaxID=3101276 RepID=UPI003B0269A4